MSITTQQDCEVSGPYYNSHENALKYALGLINENGVVTDMNIQEILTRTREQKNYKKGYEYPVKLVEYEEKERICGDNGNSYFKTNHDITAMVLKEDYYSKLSHDFHASYNVQVLVSSLLIMTYE